MDLPHRALRGALLGALLLSACAEGTGPQAPSSPGTGSASSPPSVIFIVVDTLRADVVLDPEGRYDTPNLDRLAGEGVVFPRAFSHAPMTLPSHTALFSSRLPLETGVMNNGQPVPGDLPLLAEWLHDHGYSTRAVLSLGTLYQNQGRASLQRGFERYDADFWGISQAEGTALRLDATLADRDPQRPLFLFAHFSDPHEPYNAHGRQHNPADFLRDGELVETLETSDVTQWSGEMLLPPGRTTFEFRAQEPFRLRSVECRDGQVSRRPTWELSAEMKPATEARFVIDRGEDPEAPCRLRFWINDTPPTSEVAARYASEVAYVDGFVGALLDRLDALGLYQDSVIVFTSDHGEGLGEHRLVGHVETLTDELIHVPLIVRLPRGDTRRAALVAAAEHMVSHMDVVPTLLELLGEPPLPGQRGLSLLHEHELVHVAQTHKPEASKDKVALRDERYKMIFVADENRFRMFDVIADPGEQEDVYATRKGERPDWPERLRNLYEASQSALAGREQLDESVLRELEALGYGGGKSQ